MCTGLFTGDTSRTIDGITQVSDRPRQRSTARTHTCDSRRPLPHRPLETGATVRRHSGVEYFASNCDDASECQLRVQSTAPPPTKLPCLSMPVIHYPPRAFSRGGACGLCRCRALHGAPPPRCLAPVTAARGRRRPCQPARARAPACSGVKTSVQERAQASACAGDRYTLGELSACVYFRWRSVRGSLRATSVRRVLSEGKHVCVCVQRSAGVHPACGCSQAVTACCAAYSLYYLVTSNLYMRTGETPAAPREVYGEPGKLGAATQRLSVLISYMCFDSNPMSDTFLV